jgi:hypothetical protein
LQGKFLLPLPVSLLVIPSFCIPHWRILVAQGEAKEKPPDFDHTQTAATLS